MVIVKIVAAAIALVLVVEIARAVHSHRARRRRRARLVTRPTGQVVADRIFGDIEQRIVDQTPHRHGCACSPECWQRYVDGLDSYPWSRKEDAR